MLRADLERALADRLLAADFRLFEGEGHYLLVPRAAELFALFRRGG